MQNEELKENQTEQSFVNEEREEVDSIEMENEVLEEQPVVNDSDLSNLSKEDAVVTLIKKAKILVDEADEAYNHSKELLQKDLQEYEEAKSELKENVVQLNNELLQLLNYQQNQIEILEEQEEGLQYSEEMDALDTIEKSIEVLNKEEFVEAEAYNVVNKVPSLYVNEPSSGKFGGFIVGLLGGGATFAGMAYFASMQLGIKLDPSKAPNMDTCKPIFEFYSKLVGQSDPNIGMGLMGASALVVLSIIYSIKKSSKANKNLEIAKEQLALAESYATEKIEQKENLDKIDEHIQEATELFKLYNVILNEQKAKLNRIMYLEADKIQSGEFHEKSMQEIEDTRSMVNAFKEYIKTPLVDDNEKLSIEITKKLTNMKSTLDNLLARIY